MSAVFEGYGSAGPAYDEMVDRADLRPPYRRLRSSLDTMTSADLVGRVEASQASYLGQGVTFDIGGEERALPLDILPRVIEMDTWSQINAGVQQRVEAPSRPATSPATSTAARPGRRGDGERRVARLGRVVDEGRQSFDVTNDAPISDRYVEVAVGRDDQDVKPLSGIY